MSINQSKPTSALLTRTTRKLLRPIEAVALLIQSANIAVSAVSDRYYPWAITMMWFLAAGHLVLAVLTLRYRGPLSRGFAWPGTWVAVMFTMQPLVVHAMPPGEYAAFGWGLPLGNYTLIPLVTFAFYPWQDFRSARTRWAIELGLVGGVIVQPLLLLGLMHGWELTPLHYKSVALYGTWAVVWYLVGKGIARLCRIAVSVELEALLEGREALANDLHSVVASASRAVASGSNIKDTSRNLQEIIYEHSRTLLLENERVRIAKIFKMVLRLFGKNLEIVTWPDIGPLTVPRDVATVLTVAVCDLLNNVEQHGGGRAHIDFDLHDGVMSVQIRDEGPGIDPREFYDPTSSLQRLHGDLQKLKGSLVLVANDTPGTTVRITIPLHPEGAR